MAHWAKIDETYTVTEVLVTDNDDPNGDEGYQWLVDNFGGTWIKTSYNTVKGEHLLGGTPLRMNYAGIGFTYDPIRDAFIPPKPEPYTIGDRTWEFVFKEETCTWFPVPIN